MLLIASSARCFWQVRNRLAAVVVHTPGCWPGAPASGCCTVPPLPTAPPRGSLALALSLLAPTHQKQTLPSGPASTADIVRVLKDINLNVVSAEVDTIGRNAFDKFALTYHGEALPKPMCELCINALQYYLSQNEDVEKEWSESY